MDVYQILLDVAKSLVTQQTCTCSTVQVIMYLPCQLDKEILKREQVGSEKGELVVLVACRPDLMLWSS